MTPGIYNWAVVLAVVMGVLVLVLALRVTRYRRMNAEHRANLAAIELRHYTSFAASTLIDQGDGTVHLIPRSGLRGATTETFHLNWRGVLPSRRAVYFFAGVPTDTHQSYHVGNLDTVVTVTGDDLLAHHPSQLHNSPHDNAVAVRGGYRGPGRVTPLDDDPAEPVRLPPPGSTLTRVVRALIRGR